jgi:hypothetical protein
VQEHPKNDERKKSRVIMGVMIDRSALDELVQLFRRIGITIACIRPIRTNIIKLLSILPEMKDRTCIVLRLDGSNMTSLLIAGGQCVYSSRTRLFYEPGTAEFAGEVARNVSTIQQFYSTRNNTGAVKEICIGGIQDESLRQECIRAVESIGLAVFEFSSAQKFDLPVCEDGTVLQFRDCLAELGDFVLLKEDINLYPYYRRNPQKEKKLKEFLRHCIPAAAALCIMSAASLVLIHRYDSRMNELNRIYQYLTVSQNVEDAMASDRAEYQKEQIEKKTVYGEAAAAALAARPVPDQEMIRTILSCAPDQAEVGVSGFAADTGILDLDIAVTDVTDIRRFIDALMDTGLFEQIDYSGYSYAEQAGQYSARIQGTLASEDGKQVEE